MQDQQIQQKQRYLRENILQKQYDAEEFMDFCQNYKGSIEIDSWTLQELKDIVQKFISSNSKTLQLSPFEYSAPVVASQKVQEFDWDRAFQKPQQEQTNFNLNVFDIDFLETMGMGISPPKTNKTQSNNQKSSNKILNTDPNAILAKLKSKDTQFISAYNATAMNNREKQKQGTSPIQAKMVKPMPEVNSVLIPNVKESVIIEQNFKTSIKCRAFTNKPKLDGDYEVIVSGHQIINPNIFVPNYVLYTVTTNPINKEVKRRLKDFQMLRILLKKLFPSTQIPHLERYGRLSQTQPNVIKKQKLFIESFLNSLLMNKNIRCKIIDDFLLCENLDLLKKVFRQFEKLQKPKCIEDLYTPQGKVDIQFNAINKKYVSQQQLYFDYLQPNLLKLKDLYDQLILSFAGCVKIMQDISQIYDNLRDSTRNVNNLLAENHKSTFLQATLDKISDLHKHWALSLKTQSKVLQVQIRHLFRFECDNIESMREVCKVADNITEVYAKRSDKQQAGREQYEYNKKFSDYKVGVEVPSKSTTVLKYQAGYYLQNTVNEVKRYLRQFSDKLTKKFKIFSVLQLNIDHDLQNNWKQFEQFASEIL